MRFSAPPACPTNLPRDLSASLLFCFALLQQQWLLKSFPSLAALRCFACSVIVTYLPSPRRRPSPKSVQVGRPAAPRARARSRRVLFAGWRHVCMSVCAQVCTAASLVRIRASRQTRASIPRRRGSGDAYRSQFIYHSSAPQP